MTFWKVLLKLITEATGGVLRTQGGGGEALWEIPAPRVSFAVSPAAHIAR